MKKVALLSIVLILLAISVVPVMAGDGQPNGRGNGVSAGQGNNGGNGDHQKQQDRDQDRDQDQLRVRSSNPGAGGNGNHEHTRMRTPFYLQGTISAVGAGTLTVTLTHGNARVKEYLGTDLSLVVPEGTQIFQITQGDEISGTLGTDTSVRDVSDDGTPSNRIPITLDQLTTGQKVAIHGNLAETLFTARLITGYVQAP